MSSFAKESSQKVKYTDNGNVLYDSSAIIIEESKSSMMGSLVRSLGSDHMSESKSSNLTDSPRRSNSIRTEQEEEKSELMTNKSEKKLVKRKKIKSRCQRIDENDEICETNSIGISD